MNILAIDTSSKNASVAILNDKTVKLQMNNNDEKTHSQKIMPMIDEILNKTNLTLNDINLISCCIGPGSFTGVRIGIATSKAFCDTKRISAVGVSSLESLAYQVNKEGIVCSIIDAGHGNVYAGLFELKLVNQEIKIINKHLMFLSLKDENNTLTNKNLINFIKNSKNTNNIDILNKNIYFIGDAAKIYKELILSLILPNKIEVCEYCNSSATFIGILGYMNYKEGNYGDSSILSPLYLRKSQAEIMLEEKTKNKIK